MANEAISLGKVIRQDNRPYWLKRLTGKLVRIYINRFLAPQFESIGVSPTVMGARHVELFGKGINVGNNPTFVATSDSKIRLTTWSVGGYNGKIYAGDFCLFTPGVRIAAATEIKIGNGCMFATVVMFLMLIGTEYTREQSPLAAPEKLNLRTMSG